MLFFAKSLALKNNAALRVAPDFGGGCLWNRSKQARSGFSIIWLSCWANLVWVKMG